MCKGSFEGCSNPDAVSDVKVVTFVLAPTVPPV